MRPCLGPPTSGAAASVVPYLQRTLTQLEAHAALAGPTVLVPPCGPPSGYSVYGATMRWRAGATGGIRTLDLLFTKQLLCP